MIMKFRNIAVGFAVLFAVIAVSMAAKAQAQNSTGTISGVVQDGSGAAISGTAVKIVNEATGDTIHVASSDQGRYEASSLAPGSYQVEVSVEGFETSVQKVVLAAGQAAALNITLTPAKLSQDVTVTARGIEEEAQQVTIPLTVVDNTVIEKTGAFNVNRLKELVPSVQFYSTNPRNSAVNIRGLGSPFGLTNDGLEQGVGMYVDGVYFARPAAATLDFVDVDQIEILRGPQGSLYGKNTTAGAINVTTKKPTFTPETSFELNYGNFGFVQAKASVSGPLIDRKLAARLSFSGTQRDGTIFNTRTQDYVNTLNNLGVRNTFLYVPTSKVALKLAVDYTRQRPRGYTQVVAGVVPTLQNPNRQYAAEAATFGYTPPSFNAFDRTTDVDTSLRSYQDLGGGSLTGDFDLGPGQLASITAWRYWNWNPSSDRDFIGLPITTISAAVSKQRQWTQEVRYTSKINSRLNVVTGAFLFYQTIRSAPTFKQEQGSAAWRFLLSPSANAATPGLLDGYGYNQFLDFSNLSSALYGQVEYSLTSRLRVIPGLRFNYDKKDVNFNQQIYGGLQTTNAALIALQRSVIAPQSYATNVHDTNLSGQLTLAYSVKENVNAYATFATGYKSIGLNLTGLPTDAVGNPVLSSATVKPEDVHHFEVGVKTRPTTRTTANFTLFNTDIKNFQTQVVNGSVGVVRGYLATAQKVRVRGAEFDGNLRVNDHLSFFSSLAATDGRYIRFPDAPPPLEEVGGPQTKDISGSVLPGIPKWAGTLGGEYSHRARFFGRSGEFFLDGDSSYRSPFSSSPTASRYLVVGRYALLNARVGYRWGNGWSASLWSKNLLNKNYFELLSVVSGNSGLYVGQPGDPRTFGVTLKGAL
jgi:iron complex outermembrane receptor protein